MFKAKEILTIHQEGIFTKQHIAIRPTRLGIALLVISLAIWIGAANYQVNAAYLICFWIICFTLISALLTARQLLGLALTIHYTDEVFAGENAQVQVQFTSTAPKRTRLFWLRSEWTDDQINELDDLENPLITAWQRCTLSGSQPFHYLWSIPVQKRGYFPRPLILRLATTAPFALFSVECRLEWQTEAIVYPAPLAHQDFGQQSAPNTEQTPQQTAIQGEDVAYLKPHQPHSSLQHIAWKVYAKRGELMDKVFDEPPPILHKQTISYQDYPPNTPKDKLASLLTYRILQAEQSHLPYTLELKHLSIPPQNNQREKCLNALALM